MTAWRSATFSFWMAGFCALVVVTLAVAFGPCVRPSDSTLARVELVSRHTAGGDCDWNGDCGSGDNTGYDGRGDNENSRRRNRGAFSPGPFDRSPVEMHDVDMCISLDCSGRDKKDDKKTSPPEQRSQSLLPVPTSGIGDHLTSLFPPSPAALRDFVLATIKAGIDMGRLFAETAVNFVENLLVGIA